MAVGKSTTARALQEQLPGLWLRWEVDKAQPQANGTIAEYVDAADLSESEGRMFRSNLGAIRAYVDQGWSLIAELVVLDRDLQTFDSALHGLTVHLVALTAAYRTISQRIERDGRSDPAHLSSYQTISTHGPTGANFVVATDDLTPEQVANRIRTALLL